MLSRVCIALRVERSCCPDTEALCARESWHPAWDYNTQPFSGGCCRFPGYETAEQPHCPNNGTGPCTGQWQTSSLYHWAVFVANISTPVFDAAFLSTVGWSPSEAKGWQDLSACAQLKLLRQSFNHFAQDFYTQTLRRLKALRPKARWSFWAYPKGGFPSIAQNLELNSCEEGCSDDTSTCGYQGPGTGHNRTGSNGTVWMQRVNDELHWLWSLVGAFVPSLYPMQYVQDTGTPPCGAQSGPWGAHWTDAMNREWMRSNLAEFDRIRGSLQLTVPIQVYFWYYYTGKAGGCAAKSNTFVNTAGVQGFFQTVSESAADAIVLWGSARGAAADGIAHNLTSWAPTVTRYCRPVS